MLGRSRGGPELCAASTTARRRKASSRCSDRGTGTSSAGTRHSPAPANRSLLRAATCCWQASYASLSQRLGQTLHLVHEGLPFGVPYRVQVLRAVLVMFQQPLEIVRLLREDEVARLAGELPVLHGLLSQLLKRESLDPGDLLGGR